MVTSQPAAVDCVSGAFGKKVTPARLVASEMLGVFVRNGRGVILRPSVASASTRYVWCVRAVSSAVPWS